jgi:hypothetical protein
MANFDDFVQNWKTAINSLIQESYSDFLKEAKSDAESFLSESESDLINWTKALANGQLSKDEFASLVQSNVSLLELTALKHAGLAQIRLDSFVDSLIKTTLSVAVETFL